MADYLQSGDSSLELTADQDKAIGKSFGGIPQQTDSSYYTPQNIGGTDVVVLNLGRLTEINRITFKIHCHQTYDFSNVQFSVVFYPSLQNALDDNGIGVESRYYFSGELVGGNSYDITFDLPGNISNSGENYYIYFTAVDGAFFGISGIERTPQYNFPEVMVAWGFDTPIYDPYFVIDGFPLLTANADKAISKQIEILPPLSGSSLVLHMKMNDNDTTAVVIDSSQTANDGILQDYAQTEINTEEYNDTGKINNTLVLGPIDNGSFVATGFNPAYDVGGTLSISLWLKIQSAFTADTIYPLFQMGDSANSRSYVFFTVSTDGVVPYVTFEISNIITELAEGVAVAVSLSPGSWYHIVVTYDKDDSTKIYLDEVLEHTEPAEGAGIDVTDEYPIYIGADYEFFFQDVSNNIYIDDFRLYNRVLTAGEVSDLWNDGNGTEDEAVVLGQSSYGGVVLSGGNKRIVSYRRIFNASLSLSAEGGRPLQVLTLGAGLSVTLEKLKGIKKMFEFIKILPVMEDYDTLWRKNGNTYQQTLTLNLDCTAETNCIITMLSAPGLFTNVPTFNGVPMTHLGVVSSEELANVEAYYLMNPAPGPGVLSYYSVDVTGGDICFFWTAFAYKNVVGLPIVHTTSDNIYDDIIPTAGVGVLLSQATTALSGTDLTVGPNQTLIRAEAGDYRSRAASTQEHNGVSTQVYYATQSTYRALLVAELSGALPSIGFVLSAGIKKAISSGIETAFGLLGDAIKMAGVVADTIISLASGAGRSIAGVAEATIGLASGAIKAISNVLGVIINTFGGAGRVITGITGAVIGLNVPDPLTTEQNVSRKDMFRIANANADPLKLTGPFTVECWYRQDFSQYDGDHSFFTTVDYNLYEGGFVFAMQGSGVTNTLFCQWLVPGDYSYANSLSVYDQSLYDNVWTHLACVADPATPSIKFYINGVFVANNNEYLPGGIYPTASTYPYYFVGGIDHPTAGPYNMHGNVTEMRVWDKARSQAEIQADMNQQLVGNEANLVGYWRFAGNGNDSSVNGLDLEPFNSPQYQGLTHPFLVPDLPDPILKRVSKFLDVIISVTQPTFKRFIKGVADVTIGLSAIASTMFTRTLGVIIKLTPVFSEMVSTSVLWLRASMDWIWNQGRSVGTTLSATRTILVKKANEATIILDSKVGRRFDGIAEVVITLTATSFRLSRRLFSVAVSLSALIVKRVNKYLEVVIISLSAIYIKRDLILEATLNLASRAIPGLVRYISLTLSALFSYVKNYRGEVPVYDDPDTEPDNDIPTDNSGGGDGDQEEYVMCHVPGGLWSARHTIIVRGKQSLNSHIAQHPGDHAGPCSNGN